MVAAGVPARGHGRGVGDVASVVRRYVLTLIWHERLRPGLFWLTRLALLALAFGFTVALLGTGVIR